MPRCTAGLNTTPNHVKCMNDMIWVRGWVLDGVANGSSIESVTDESKPLRGWTFCGRYIHRIICPHVPLLCRPLSGIACRDPINSL